MTDVRTHTKKRKKGDEDTWEGGKEFLRIANIMSVGEKKGGRKREYIKGVVASAVYRDIVKLGRKWMPSLKLWR